MDIQKFAPVYIPTLNRYEHFKRCLDSLEQCTWADQTDVYIGLDYPPTEKYFEGWQKIDAYLVEKEKRNGFKHLYVRRRDHNCGVGRSGSNASLLKAEVISVSDRFIFSEDDNEFAPNFLVFVNKGLTLYEKDKNVLAISGYSFPELEKKKLPYSFLAPFSNAWGTGYWVDKTMDYTIKGGNRFVNEVLSSWRLSWKLFRKRSASLDGFLSMHFSGNYYGDVLRTSEMILQNKYTLYPSLSKVRNWGHDGTGTHCGTTEKYKKQKMDESTECDNIANARVIEIANLLDHPWYLRLFVLARFVCYKITGKDMMFIYRKIRKQ